MEYSLGHALQLLKGKVLLNGAPDCHQELDGNPLKQRRQVDQAIFQPFLHLLNKEVLSSTAG